jgi:hypothetical protein
MSDPGFVVRFYWVVAWCIRDGYRLVIKHHYPWFAIGNGDPKQYPPHTLTPATKTRNPGNSFGRRNENKRIQLAATQFSLENSIFHHDWLVVECDLVDHRIFALYKHNIDSIKFRNV